LNEIIRERFDLVSSYYVRSVALSLFDRLVHAL
jgi:hypothetical protein